MVIWVVTAALGAPTHAGIEGAAWTELTRVSNANAGEVVVWRASVGGVDCFRGTAVTDVPPLKLVAVVADVEGAKRWSSAGITDAKLLARAGNQLTYYQYLDVPGWTMSADRFWFLTSTLVQTETKASLQWNQFDVANSPHKPVYEQVKADNPSAIEPTVNVGSWAFEGTAPSVKVIYSICTLPGGSIPTAIQNAATKKTLPDTVGDAIKEAKRR